MLECCLTFRERNRPPFMNEFLGCHLLTHRPLTPQLSAIATGLRTSDVLLWLTIGRLTPRHTLTRFHHSVNRKGLGYCSAMRPNSHAVSALMSGLGASRPLPRTPGRSLERTDSGRSALEAGTRPRAPFLTLPERAFAWQKRALHHQKGRSVCQLSL